MISQVFYDIVVFGYQVFYDVEGFTFDIVGQNFDIEALRYRINYDIVGSNYDEEIQYRRCYDIEALYYDIGGTYL